MPISGGEEASAREAGICRAESSVDRIQLSQQGCTYCVVQGVLLSAGLPT